VPTYLERLEFMDHHFHLQVRQKGERFGCLSFRKVANWYCRVLKPGHETQQRLIMIGTCADFEAIVEQLRDRFLQHGPPPGYTGQATIPVPGGPIDHW
jgi:tRNA-dihydrouridine synthase B